MESFTAKVLRKTPLPVFSCEFFWNRFLIDHLRAAAIMVNQLIPWSLDFRHLQIFYLTLQCPKNVIKNPAPIILEVTDPGKYNGTFLENNWRF